MRRMRLPAALLFLAVFAAALVVQAPAELSQRFLGTSTPPVLALIAPRLTEAAGEIPSLGITEGETRLDWRYERFSFRRFGPVYRVGLAGRGFAGKGVLAMAPLSRRLLLTDVRLALSLAHLHGDLRQAAFEPLGRVSVTLDRFEADVRPWGTAMLAGQARWEGARSALVPGIELGVVEAQLSTPEPNVVRAGITNHGGDLAVSGTLTLGEDGNVDVDLFIEPRSGSPEAWTHALETFSTREGTGWRLQRTIITRGWR